jgi:glucose-6-phosphate 1-dehydrogenase
MSRPGPVIVIFGITGDLSKRYLLPALYHLMRHDLLPADTKIVGISRRELTPEELLKTVELCVLETDKVCDPEGLKKVHQALQTQKLDPAHSGDFNALQEVLDNFDTGHKRTRLLYMSVPAGAYGPIVEQLGRAGLNDGRTRLLLEKPFGSDLASAAQLIELVARVFDEEHVYRIDHYLAKEGAQNLLGFRSHNPAFIPLWNGKHIDTITVSANEAIGIEGRSSFYEQTGALRDFVQNHLVQLLATTLMDVPEELNSAAVHANKHAVLSKLAPANPGHATRGQYKGYRHETGNPESTVETYVRLELHSEAPQWQGATFVLETGKAMAERRAQIEVRFKAPPGQEANSLVFHIQPEEHISINLANSDKGFEAAARQANLDYRFKDAPDNRQRLDAYERVLTDAVHGDQLLFAGSNEILESWRILQPLLDAWGRTGEGLVIYPKGSAYPAAG